MGCRVVSVDTGSAILCDDSSDDDVICLDDPQPKTSGDDNDKQLKEENPLKMTPAKDQDEYMYRVKEVKGGEERTVKASLISRKKGLFTREKLKLYLKHNCEVGADSYWRVKNKLVKKYDLNSV